MEDFVSSANDTERDTPTLSQASQAVRREFILNRLHEDGQVDVGEMADAFAVSTMTIRRDLAHLDEEGLARRVHGGATARLPAASRAVTMADEKLRIAKAVRGLVSSGETIGIDVGTTCTAVAKQLAAMDDIYAISNSLHAAMQFQQSASSMIVLGGRLTPEASLVHGGLLELRRGIHLDKLVLGCGGISVDDGVSYFDLAETEVRMGLVANSDMVIMAADHTKLDRRRPIVLDGLEVLDVLVTTAEPSPALRDALDRASVEVLIV